MLAIRSHFDAAGKGVIAYTPATFHNAAATLALGNGHVGILEYFLEFGRSPPPSIYLIITYCSNNMKVVCCTRARCSKSC